MLTRPRSLAAGLWGSGLVCCSGSGSGLGLVLLPVEGNRIVGPTKVASPSKLIQCPLGTASTRPHPQSSVNINCGRSCFLSTSFQALFRALF